ncbi:MAG: hypothetical protein B7733_18135 [Myxococcales bacterium FL481]|nr:MAG: hypothetical protein B7733_18135 [Myxococcales bacterium FL481]
MHVNEDASAPSRPSTASQREREEAALTWDDEDDEMLEPPRRRRRSPLVAVFVVLFGVYLLVSMWADFRHWLRSPDDVEDLGHARDLIENGRFIRDFDNAYAELEATVDLQHAAKLTTANGEARYLRLREGGMSLFAQIPQVEGERADTVPDRFRGRMRRHGDVPSFVWARKFFENEAIVQTLDVTHKSAVAGRRNDAGEVVIRIEGDDREVALQPRDELRFVVPARTAVIQLGKSTWPNETEARASVAALGVPFVAQERPSSHAHSYVAAIPTTDRDSARQRLEAGRDVPANNADPKVGATVLSRTRTYAAPVAEIEWTGAGWRLPLGYAHPGYEVRGDTLAPRSTEDGRIQLSADQVRAVRLDRKLELDEDGYVIIVGEEPASQRLTALLFLVVCGLVLANLASLALWIRNRR